MIRKPVIQDVPEIKAMIEPYVQQGVILPKSLHGLYSSIRDFWIEESESDDVPGILGCCGLQVTWEDLAEIRTLAVREGYHGQGIGRMLVERCMDEARELGLQRLFVLSYVPEFFETLGFKVVDKSELPNKIWADCIHCPHFPDCRETALTFTL